METPATEPVVDSVTTLEDPAVPAAEPVVTPEPTTEGTPAEPQQAAQPVPETPPSEWKASFKYKVKDDEHDMPEWVHPLIKDEATEKEIKTLFSRGHGIEDIKKDRQSLRDELAEIKEAKEGIDQSLNVLSEYVQKGDMRSFFEALQIPKELVMKYAIEELKYQEMSPEQRQKIDNERHVNQQLQQLQYQNQTLQQQSEQARIAQKRVELNVELSKPDVSTVAQQFDAKNGAGAFEREVINQGVLAYHTQGIELTTEQAVKKTLGLIGAFSSTAEPAVATPPTQTPDPAQVKQPVIPNVQSQGQSPVRQAPQSLADLRKLADQMGAQA